MWFYQGAPDDFILVWEKRLAVPVPYTPGTMAKPRWPWQFAGEGDVRIWNVPAVGSGAVTPIGLWDPELTIKAWF